MSFHTHHHDGDCASQSDRPDASVSLKRALWITVAFMFVEAIGGYFANSLALLSDAAHMLTDVGAISLSLFALWVSRRPSTPTMSFGYHRAEILGALASGLAIWLLAGLLSYEAILRLKSPPAVQGPIVFVVAAIGLCANLASMWMLHRNRDENMNIRAAYLHMIADALGSIGALIAGAVLWFTDWRPIDPIVTIFFSLMMLVGSWRLVRESVGVLMESTPAHLDPEEVRRELQALPGVKEAHDLHIWTVSSGRLALSVHLISTEYENVLNSANQVLLDRYGIKHTTIQVEHPERFQSDRCYDCATH